MDTETIALICSIVVCLVGLATFLFSVIGRAKQDGQLFAKIDFCNQTVKEIKETLNQQNATVTKTQLAVATFETRIQNLETRVKMIEKSRNG